MTRKGRRIAMIAGASSVVAAAAGLALYALSDNIVFFFSPSELAAKNVAIGSRLRIGGLVEPGSVVKCGEDRLEFSITDGCKDVKVSFPACRPTFFARGRAWSPRACSNAPGQFRAETILAKHDERYMPREVVEELKKQGRWQEGETGNVKP